ncbi:hypothetical protein cce_3921 [Crocosphaera subtropica ATCC 51142]|uniref:DUF4278 domain-containing protein n=1 Tax=Crocosphaera subtropica (strain ATCC 51142 / BH68) TaxID=43989 RepID=B1WPV4_CROS5|nr:DUF4278 domain-containing protein [Crocosphaera subtropica]ACB53269.1 hypothetical protein cce_3921 [Crocosphaera subtropica ATCC 51142]
MKLIYRGIQYDNTNTPNIVNQEKQLTAKYRGISYQVSLNSQKAKQVNHILKYRGVNYNSQPNKNVLQTTPYSTGIDGDHIPNHLIA